MELLEILKNEVDSILSAPKENKKWNSSSTFWFFKQLEIDERGRAGQEFFQKVFSKAGYRTRGDDDHNGDWDIKINNFRIEVKTATLDVNGNFQHESLHQTSNYDFVFFLDIAPEEICFSICKYNDIPFDSLHLRGKANRPTGAGFKWDTRYKWYQIENRNEIKAKNITKIPMFRKVVRSVNDIVTLFESACNDPTYNGLIKKIKGA